MRLILTGVVDLMVEDSFVGRFVVTVDRLVVDKLASVSNSRGRGVSNEESEEEGDDRDNGFCLSDSGIGLSFLEFSP